MNDLFPQTFTEPPADADPAAAETRVRQTPHAAPGTVLAVLSQFLCHASDAIAALPVRDDYDQGRLKAYREILRFIHEH